MSFPLVDYHCHLDLYPDFEKVIEECEENQIYTLAVTTTPRAFPKNQELISNKKYVRAALGLHPQLVASRADEINLWVEYADQTRYIGEVGLDAGTQHYKSFDLQKTIFKTILDTCATKTGKILSIHSIRSAPMVLQMLERSLVLKENKAVLHWFTGDASSLRKAVELGCYFSINSEMLKSERSRNLISQIPIQRLLTETDGPFVHINQRPTRPKDIIQTIELLSPLIKKDVNEVARIVLTNLLRMEDQ